MSNKSNALRSAASLICLLLWIMLSVGSLMAADNTGSTTPVGTWFGYVELGGPQIWMMPTFFADGNVIANDSFDLCNFPTKHSTAHGTWTRLGARQFKATFYWLNLDDTTVPATYLGFNEVVMIGEIDPKDKNKIINGTITSTPYPASCGNPMNLREGCIPGGTLGPLDITELLRVESK